MVLKGLTFDKGIVKENIEPYIQDILRFMHNLIVEYLSDHELIMKEGEKLGITLFVNLLESLACNIHPVDLKHKYAKKILEV